MEKPQKSVPASKKEYEVQKAKNDKVKVSLWLDDYDNIFSDFDPRSFSRRELSDDFLSEAIKITGEVKTGKLILILLMPLSKKNPAIEKIIKTKLHSYFQKQFHQLHKEQQKIKSKGIGLAFLGIFLMLVATLVSYYFNDQIIFHLFRVILEPAGWFTAWYGLDHVFYLSKDGKKEFEFYQKMAEAEIKFDVY